MSNSISTIESTVDNCSAETAVGEQNAVIDTHHESLAQNRLRLRWPHGHGGDGGPDLFADAQCGLQRVEVIRIHLGLHAVTFQDARLRVNLHLGGSRHLFDADNDFH